MAVVLQTRLVEDNRLWVAVSVGVSSLLVLASRRKFQVCVSLLNSSTKVSQQMRAGQISRRSPPEEVHTDSTGNVFPCYSIVCLERAPCKRHTSPDDRSDTWQDGFVSFCWIVQCSAVV